MQIPVAALLKDGETMPLLAIRHLQLGMPGVLDIDVRRCGVPKCAKPLPWSQSKGSPRYETTMEVTAGLESTALELVVDRGLVGGEGL